VKLIAWNSLATIQLGQATTDLFVDGGALFDQPTFAFVLRLDGV